MSEPDNFLTRWSRRKRGAEENHPADQKTDRPAPPDNTQIEDAPLIKDRAAQSENKKENKKNENKATELAFDLSKLPSLDSITADSDIRPFMAPGVPESLRYAALRRAWLADPEIRDLVELAEYAWDFTAEGSMAGFGSLDPSEVPKLMKTFLGTSQREEPESEIADTNAAGKDTEMAATAAETTGNKTEIDTPADIAASPETGPLQHARSAMPHVEDGLLQRNEEAPSNSQDEQNKTRTSTHLPNPRRGHGGAMPQ